MAVRYGPGVFDPAGSVALTAPGPFSWASLAAVLAQRRMQRLLLAWAVRSLPVMLLSAAQLLRQRQVARRAAVAAAAAAAIAQRPAGKGQQQASSSSVPAVSPLPAAAAKDAGTQRAAEPATRSGPSGAASSSLPAAPSYKLESLQPRAVALKPGAARSTHAGSRWCPRRGQPLVHGHAPSARGAGSRWCRGRGGMVWICAQSPGLHMMLRSAARRARCSDMGACGRSTPAAAAPPSSGRQPVRPRLALLQMLPCACGTAGTCALCTPP
jgi:hypothetical protein